MKASLRKSIRAKLAGMNPAVAHAKSMSACKRLLAQAEFQRAEVVMIYLPLPDEVDITPIALRGWQEQKTVVAPKIDWRQRRMFPIAIHSLETGLVKGRHGIPEPDTGEPILLEMLDLVIVPGVAYDRRGGRLGRGGGFYDRFLSSPQFAGVAAGIAFCEQVVQELQMQENDVPVNMLVTDEEVMRFAPAERAENGKDAGR